MISLSSHNIVRHRFNGSAHFSLQPISEFAPDLIHGFTTRQKPSPDSAEKTYLHGYLANRSNAHPRPIVHLEQPHGSEIFDARPDTASIGLKGPNRGFDGAIARTGNPLLISIRTADCAPILAMDTELGEFAALHAGWRGAAKGILLNLLRLFRHRGSSLRNVRLAIGPCIQACCFEVQSDCVEKFEARHIENSIAQRGRSYYLDLPGILSAQALLGGLQPEQLFGLHRCTMCYTDENGYFPFASYRRDQRDGKAMHHRNISFIGVNAENG